MASFSLEALDYNSIQAKISGMSGSHERTRYYHWYLNDVFIKETYTEPGKTSTSYTFRNLTGETEYTVYVEVLDTPAHNSAVMASFSDSITTPRHYTAYYTTTATSNSITFHVYEIKSGDIVRFYAYDPSEVDRANTSVIATSGYVSKVISGLKPGTEYRVNVEINSTYLCGTDYVTTPPNISYSWYFTTGYKQVQFSISGLKLGDSVRLVVKDGSNTIISDKTNTVTSLGTTGIITGSVFNPGESYTGIIYINGSKYETFDIAVPRIAMVSDLWIDTNNISFNVYNMVSGERAYARVYGSNYDDESTIYANNQGYANFSFYGLKHGTTYNIYVEHIDSNDSITKLLDSTFTTDSITKPDEWEWDTVVEQGKPILLTAYEWNNFVQRINDLRLYLDIIQISDFTEVKGGITMISDDIVNEAWDAINNMNGHGSMPTRAVSGQPITASFFNGLKDAFNAMI